MRRLFYVVVSFIALTAATAIADGLKIQAGGQGVTVQGNQFWALATSVTYDEAKGLLTLEGTKDVPAQFFRAVNDKGPSFTGVRIFYQLKTNQITVLPLLVSDKTILPATPAKPAAAR